MRLDLPRLRRCQWPFGRNKRRCPRRTRSRSLKRFEALEPKLLLANDLAPLSDEFNDAGSLADWQRINEVEGWNADQLVTWDVDTSQPGRMFMRPHTVTWYQDYRGPLAFKEVTGDFVITTEVHITDRDDLGTPDADDLPSEAQFSLAGVMIRTPRPIQDPATDWIPGSHQDDGTNDGENFVFLSAGYGNSGSQFQLEEKTTRNSNSVLTLTGIGQNSTVTVQIARIGNEVFSLYQIPGQDWIVHRRYERDDMPATLQVGLVSYSDWDKVNDFQPYFHNSHTLEPGVQPDPTPGVPFNPDIEAGFEYARFARPVVPAELQGIDLLTQATDEQLIAFLGDNANQPVDPFPIPLEAKDPLGSLIYDPTAAGSIATAGGSAAYSIDLDGQQTVTLIVEPSAGLQASVELFDPDSNSLGVTAAAAAGEDVILQTIATTTPGTYTMVVSGDNDTSGDFDLQLLLNSAAESESYGGASNDLAAAAQNLGESFVELGNGPAERGAVLGQLPISTGIVVEGDDFESGQLDGQWTTSTSTPEGRIQVTGAQGTAAGSFALLMDVSQASIDNLNEAVWTVDLSGIASPTLNFFHAEWNDEINTLPADFTGSLPGDGVAISDDGANWHTLLSAPDQTAGQWVEYSYDLTAEAAAAGMTLGAGFRIKFQQYDNFPLVTDGRGYDEITITTPDPGVADWYSFSLDDGQSATIALTALDAGQTALDLYEADGTTLLASGTGAVNVDSVINNFVDETIDAVATTYLVRVSGADAQYSLVVTRGADFDTEANNDAANAQDITGVGGVLGHVAAEGTSAPAFGSEGEFAASSLVGPVPVVQQFAGPSFSGFIPPDPNAAAGPEQIVTIINTQIAVYDKASGVKLFQQNLNGPTGFFGSVGATDIVFDPWVLFDTDSQRFFAIGIDLASDTESNLFVAVSNDATPTTASEWHKYKIDFTHVPDGTGLGTGAHFPDYEKLGVNADAIWISGNYFPINAGSGVYAGITAIEKAPLLSGGPANIVYEEHFNGFSVFPMTQYGSAPGDPQYFAQSSTGGGSSITIHAVTDVLTSPQRTTTTVAVPSFSSPVNVPQQGGGTAADAIDSRIMTGVWRDGSMWFAHAITDPAIGDGESVARWYEVATNNFPVGAAPSLVQSGSVDPGPGVHAWMPAIAVDGAGNMGIGFALGGPNQFYGAGFTGRLASDPAGDTAFPVTQYATGLANYQRIDGVGRNRWGDYSGLSVDPSNDGTFWVFNEYATASNTWATEVASFKLNSPSDDDWFSFDVSAGNSLDIETFAPGGGPFEFVNTVDVQIELFDPVGGMIAHTNVAGNEQLTHVAQLDGQYKLHVFAAPGTAGEYFVSVSGATGDDVPPQVIDADPDNGATLAAFPATYTLDFSEAILGSSVTAGDLTIGGLPALDVAQIDGDTFAFEIDPNANVGDGVYNVVLAADAVTDLQGTGNVAFNGSFVLDTTGPTIVSTSWNGQPLPADKAFSGGTVTFAAVFDEKLFALASPRRGPFAPGPDDVTLVNTLTNESFTPTNVVYDDSIDTFTADFAGLTEGTYTLTLISGDGGFEDLVGNDLDGEPLGGNLDGTPTGDGVAGGDYSIDFTIDLGGPVAANNFVRLQPLGSLITASQANLGVISSANDTDDFQFSAQAGETIAAVAVPDDASVVLSLQLFGAAGPISPVVTAPFPGAPVVLPLSAPLASNVPLTITVGGDGTTQYSLDIFANASIEATVGDSRDFNELDITDSFIDLGSGRYGVVGRSAPEPLALQPFVYVAERNVNGTDGAVNVYDLDGNLVNTITHPDFDLGDVTDVEIGPGGDVFVGVDLDGGAGGGSHGEVVRFTPDGTFVATIAIPDDAPGGITFYPLGFEVFSDGSLLVAKPAAEEIVLLNSDGSLNTTFPIAGTSPIDVGVLSDGTIVFADDVAPYEAFLNVRGDDRFWIAVIQNDVVELRDAAGTVFATRPGDEPIDAQEAADGSLFTTNFNSATLQKFNPAGVSLFEIGAVGQPEGLAVPSGEVIAAPMPLAFLAEGPMRLIAARPQGNTELLVTPIRETPSANHFAVATELIVNGGFETGDFTGWTALDNGLPELTPWTVGPAGGGWFGNSAPLGGTFDAYNGFDGDAGLEYELYQDVSVPAGSMATLTTNHRIVYDGFGISSTQDRIFEISVRDTSNNVLQTLYTENITMNGAPETDLGWNTQTFDLSAFAGQDVRIHFHELVPESSTGPANLELDDVSLLVGDAGVLIPDVDEYTIDLTGKAGQVIDIVLAGQGIADFSGQTLDLLDVDGSTVLEMAKPEPLLLGQPAENYDLAILGFVVPYDGEFTVRLTSRVSGDYAIAVTDSLVFDTEPNDASNNPLRAVDVVGDALGYVAAPGQPGGNQGAGGFAYGRQTYSEGDVGEAEVADKAKLVVRFDDGFSQQDILGWAGARGATVIQYVTHVFNGAVIEVDAAQTGNYVTDAGWLGTSVRYAEPDSSGQYLETFPNDPLFGQMWALDNTGQTGGTSDADIDAPEAWDVFTDSSNVVIAIVDSGVNYNHEDLAPRMWQNPGEIPGNGIDDDSNGYIDDVYGIDPGNGDSDPMDGYGHGTHVAGTAAAAGNNGIGVTGINWNAQIMALAIGTSGPSTTAAIVALDYMVMMKTVYGVNIVSSNHSYGVGDSQAFQDAIQASINAGIVFVAAAGNDGTNLDTNPQYPAAYPFDGIISVAATDQNDNRASFSNYGATSVDLGAPGVSILSTMLTSGQLSDPSGYGLLSGTSMASPHVTGAAALIAAANPGLSVAEIKQAILDGVDPIPALQGITVSGGRLNLANTLAFDPSVIGPTVLSIDPAVGVSTDLNITEITIQFSEQITAASATDQANYLFIEAGPNQIIEDGAGDDDVIPVTPAFDGDRIVTLMIDPAYNPLPIGVYQLRIDGDSSIEDLDGNPLNSTTGPGGGSDHVHYFAVDLESDGDLYTLNAVAGDEITISTATPFDDPASTVPNTLDPTLIVIGPSGGLVATDDNSGPDGRNALVNFTAPETGRYLIQVLAVQGSGEYTLDVSVQAVPTGSIGDFVWNDLDGDGIQDASELGIDGVTVNLLDANTLAQLDTTITAGGGLYSFSALDAGDYVVEFVAPGGFTFSPNDQGGDDTADSDADPSDGRTDVVTLAIGQANDSIDAGLVGLATISDFVWNDLNADGLQDAGEPGIEGVTVNLRDSSGVNILASTTTDADGLYSFSVVPGTYVLEFLDGPVGFIFTDPDQGADDSLDSDVQPGGLTNPVTVGPGEVNDTVDAGKVAIPTVDLSIDFTTIDENPPGTATITATLSNLTTQTVLVGLNFSGTAALDDYDRSGTSITIPPRTAAGTITVTAIDDFVVEGAETIVAEIGVVNGGTFGDITQVTTTIVDDDTAGITVDPVAGLFTTEAGGQATFTIVLDTVPSADVTIALSSSNENEGTVSPASLTFTPADALTPQIVTVTGVDDGADDGDIAYSIVTSAATSGDSNYNGLNPADVTVTNVDDDEPLATLIIDNGDTGFSAPTFTLFGPPTNPAQGYQDDVHYHAASSGSHTATWTFTGLTPGDYQVAVTWSPHSNRANNAPFTVGGVAGGGTVPINQRLSPTSFAGAFLDAGVYWAPLNIGGNSGEFQLNGSTLTVTLGTSATGFVIADAVRIERMAAAPDEPEIEVFDGATNLTSGATVAFGTIAQGTPVPPRTITIQNAGTAQLDLGTLGIAGGAAFSLDTAGLDAVLDPGESTSFRVLLNTSATGPFNATVTIPSLAPNDDADENPFTINVTATIVNSIIIDNGDAGFAAPTFTRFGPPTNPAQGYQDDLHYHAASGGSHTATWTFTGLTPGDYQVAVTWTPHSNRANNAPFTVGGVSGGGTITINQRLSPSNFAGAFSDQGVFWAPLDFGGNGGQFQLSGSTLTVTLGTSVTGFVIADAVRIERLSPPPVGPEIEVFDGAASLASGATVDFGPHDVGSPPPRRTITVLNAGTAPLDLGAIQLNGDAAFSLDTTGLDAVLDPNESTTFDVVLDTSSPDSFTAMVTIPSLPPNDDADENPFTLVVTGTVVDASSLPVIIDNGDAGFAAPTFTFFGPPTYPAQGYQDDVHFHGASSGSHTAVWTFNGLTPGVYQVAATWTEHSNRATNSPFTVGGVTGGGTVPINQRVAPSGYAGAFPDDGVYWAPLMVGGNGGNYQLNGSTLTVTLGTSITGFVIADAVRIERLSGLPGTPQFATTAGGAAVDVTAAAFDSRSGQLTSATQIIARPELLPPPANLAPQAPGVLDDDADQLLTIIADARSVRRDEASADQLFAELDDPLELEMDLP